MAMHKVLPIVIFALALTAGTAWGDEVSDGQSYVKANCALCHDVTSARTVKQGPPLLGVVGRKIGSVPGFGYSETLKNAGSKGKAWTPAALNVFLADPQKAMPGTMMPVNVPDVKKRKAVIAWLGTLTGGAAKPAVLQQPVKKTATVTEAAPPVPAPANLDWHNDAPGVRHHIDVATIPAPFATPSASNGPATMDTDKAAPKVPEGFTVSVFTSDAEHPRQMRTAPNGDLFVTEEGAGRIIVYANNHGTLTPTKSVFVSGLNDPFGVAFYPTANPQWVYVASVGSVVRYPYHAGDQKASGAAETVVAHLATGGGHTSRDIIFTPDGKSMYVSVGSASNVADEMNKTPPDGWVAGHGIGQPWGSEEGRAMVLRFNPDGSGRYVYADGIRNCV
ncbi:MAG: c-type cytochrome, partial [Asticcacaulis sp.]